MMNNRHFMSYNEKALHETGTDTVHIMMNIGNGTDVKKCKEKIKEIIAAICALLNSNGGKIRVYDPKCCSLDIRMLEQPMIPIIGPVLALEINMCIDENDDSLVIVVKRGDALITTSYNICLPGESQVLQLGPREPLENIKDIINRKDVTEPVKLGSHEKTFYKHSNCGIRESKSCQLKHLKTEQFKHTKLADRMTGKSNKFSCYVSAFANYRGGHIYYGVTDDGVVEGEVLSNEDITRKVEKAINKMIWPEQIGQPKRGEHWDIFFEPVMDETTCQAIPSTFVIVIYIAPCLGCVFTEKPECYEIAEKQVKKMSFVAWKKRISEPVSFRSGEIPHSVSGITWSSDEARKAFTDTHNVIMPLINNGRWKAILEKSKSLQEKSRFYSIRRLSILSKEITACFRRGHLNKAEKLLEKYKDIVSNEKEDSFIFEVIGLYLEAALKRARGDKTDALKELLAGALSKTELIEPGVVTATVYVFAAGTILNDPANLNYSPEVLSARALEHLQHVPDCPEMVANIRKKAYLILAAFHLGCSINGRRIKESVDSLSSDKARSIIMSVHETALEGNPLSKYHEIQFNLVQSIYRYRRSQIKPEERTRLLRVALDCAEKTEYLAKENQFPEMVEWSGAIKALLLAENN